MPNQKLSFTVEEVDELLTLVDTSRTLLEAFPPISTSEMLENGNNVYVLEDGHNYNLYDDANAGTLSALSISNTSALMTVGCIVHFKTDPNSNSWDIQLPYEAVGDPLTALVKVNGGATLTCEPDKEYLLTVVAVNDGGSGANVYSLIELH